MIESICASNGPTVFSLDDITHVVAMGAIPDGAGEPFHCEFCGFHYGRLEALVKK